jgi:hypothetical protein
MKRKVRFRWSKETFGFELRFDSNTYLDFVLASVSSQYNTSIIFENSDIKTCKVKEWL